MTWSIDRYVGRGLHSVKGWLTPNSAQIVRDLALIQSELGIRGGTAEIGVHHGKLLLLLMLLVPDDPTYAIDVFDLQEFNTDGSGAGNKAAFLSNVARIVGAKHTLILIEDSSLRVTQEKIPDPIRLFSVDGGHTVECTVSDLELASSAIGEGGVIILDDVFNENWPEVSDGLSRYLAAEPRVRPFALSSNKVYLCAESWRERYRVAMKRKLVSSYDRSLRVFGSEVDIFGLSASRRDYVGYAVDRLKGVVSRFV